ncbi:MAG: hypothetical protein CK431_21335 [Mycobacterium sp.]|nr:MAG: hypothetical protein CK431_21335 [Mycobacterium sp.]
MHPATDNDVTGQVAMVCTRSSVNKHPVSEWTYWRDWQEALTAHRELSPCCPDCRPGSHLLVGLDAAGRWRVVSPVDVGAA